jgi:hypothetical protein
MKVEWEFITCRLSDGTTSKRGRNGFDGDKEALVAYRVLIGS